MQRLTTLTAQTPYESQMVQTRELSLYRFNLAQKTALNIPFKHVYPRGKQRLFGT